MTRLSRRAFHQLGLGAALVSTASGRAFAQAPELVIGAANPMSGVFAFADGIGDAPVDVQRGADLLCTQLAGSIADRDDQRGMQIVERLDIFRVLVANIHSFLSHHPDRHRVQLPRLRACTAYWDGTAADLP